MRNGVIIDTISQYRLTDLEMTDSGGGRRPIAADTALRLGLFFGIEPRFWLNLQAEYDIRVASRELHAKIAPRIRALRPMPA